VSARWVVPAIPFAFSLALSLATVGDRATWQDSGFYLAAVHEFVPLYPPGFLLYLLLCKAWTLVVAPMAGFTLAVHLFSSVCAAGAVAFIALAARDFLRRFFPDRPADFPAIVSACFLAAGYSFWHAAILAKSYALFYLMVSILLLLMVRAEKKRDFHLMAALLGLSWAAHPLASFLIPAMLLYAWARRNRIREWGWPWFAGISVTTAATALGPALLLPLLAGRSSFAGFGDPRSMGEVIDYIRGARFLQPEGSFGIVGEKWASLAGFAWEEVLGVGLILAGLGAWRVAKVWPRLLVTATVWALPITGFSLIYLLEGYPDLWMVAVTLPLTFLVAVGLSEIPRRARGWAAAVGLVWMIVANGADLNQRGHTLAEDYGRMVLKNVDPGAPLLLVGDDAIALTLHLRFVRGEGSDRRVINEGYLDEEWYRRLVWERYGLRTPDLEAWRLRMAGVRNEFVRTTAFADENAGPGRPVFCEVKPERRYLRPELEIVPAGMFWKVTAKEEARLDPACWDFAVRPEDVVRGRLRAHRISIAEKGVGWHRESYEDRLILPLLQARIRLADALLQREPAEALRLYESVRAIPSPIAEEVRFRYHRAVALYLTNRSSAAESEFRWILERDPTAAIGTMTHFYLGEIAREFRRPADAARYFRRALEIGRAEEAVLRHIRERAKQP
jgi:hypothetical protein